MNKKIICVISIAAIIVIVGISIFFVNKNKTDNENNVLSNVQENDEKKESDGLAKFTDDYRKIREVNIEDNFLIFPITYDELKKTGWGMSEEDEEKIFIKESAHDEEYIDIKNEKYPNLTGKITIDNPLKNETYIKNCLITGITLKSDENFVPKMEIYTGLKLGDSKNKISELYPNEKEEDNSYTLENCTCYFSENKINKMSFDVHMDEAIGEDAIGYDGTLNAKRRWLTQQDFSKGQIKEKPNDLNLTDTYLSKEKEIREYFGYSNQELGLDENESEFSSDYIQANKYVINKIIEKLGSPHEIKGILTYGAAEEGFNNISENEKLIVDQSVNAYLKSIESTKDDACEYYSLIWYFDGKIIDLYVMEGLMGSYASIDGMGLLRFKSLRVNDISQTSEYLSERKNVLPELFPDGFLKKDITKEPYRDYIDELKKLQEK